jgi:hypothetical protein
LWASRYRSAIGARSREFYAALLGAGSKPSWALQSAVAILALTALVVAINPDLMEHLESIKAGEVEAKFSSVSTATREAHITSLNPLENELAIQKWIGFNENYAGKSPRNAALMLFDNSEIKNDRVHIRNVLFDRYLEPLVVFLGCLEHTELLPIETRSASFVTLAVSLRNALVEEPKRTLFDKEKLFGLLRMIDREIVNIDQIIQTNLLRSQQKTCEKFMFDPGNETTMTSIRWRIYGESSSKDGENNLTEVRAAGSRKIINRGPLDELIVLNQNRLQLEAMSQRLDDFSAEDADFLNGCLVRGADKLDKIAGERKYTLWLIDPYIVALVGDLVALALGQAEKAKFLTLVKDEYPTETKFFQPGLVNLYYQLGDVKNHVEASWPLSERFQELNQAMAGVDYVIAEAMRAKDAEAGGAEAKGAETKEAEVQPSQSPSIDSCDKALERPRLAPEDYSKIIDVYFTVKFYVTSKFMEVYYLRALAGDPLSEHDKVRWSDFYHQLERILNSNGSAIKLEIANSSDIEIPAADLPFWRVALSQMDQFQRFDAELSMALSSVMLTENRFQRAPRQACAVALHYLSEAKDLINLLPDIDKAERDQLRGYTTQTEARISASCP